MKLRRVKSLDVTDLSADSVKIMRCIVTEILRPTGYYSNDDVDSAIKLIEAGYLRIMSDGKNRYWFEQTLPEFTKALLN